MRRWSGKEIPQDVMERREAAVWLGRAISTHDVTIRVVLQLLDVATIQQQVIQALYEEFGGSLKSRLPADLVTEMDGGQSADILEKLSRLREQVSPILNMVDESCQELEGML